MEWVDVGGAARVAFTARRNNSLTSRGRLLVFGFLFAVSLGIALAFTVLHGAWPLLPCAGAEVVGLYLAWRCMERHAGDFERVAIERDLLIVEVTDGNRRTREAFSRHWAKVIVAEDEGTCRVAIRSHGRQAEIGRHLDASGRRSLARRLRRELAGT
jgi:uncharacterized membrane protein